VIRGALACLLVATVGAAAPGAKATRIVSPRFFPGWQAHNVAFPAVLSDSTTGGYRMFYAGSPAGRINASTWDRWVTLTATSRDGLAWTFPDDYEPVLFAHRFREGEVADQGERTGRFDSVSAFGSSALRERAGYRLWYTGWSGAHEPVSAGVVRDVGFAIGLATSPDGVKWTKRPGNAGAEAVLAPAPGEPDARGAGQPCVLRDGAALRMWYECFDGTRWRICSATSTDGTVWAKEGMALDVGAEGAPDALGLRNPVVVRRRGTYELWYQGQGGAAPHYRVLRARSPDGKTWTRLAGEVALHPETAVADDERIHVDSVVVLPGGAARVFFAKEITTRHETAYGAIANRSYHIYTEIVRP